MSFVPNFDGHHYAQTDFNTVFVSDMDPYSNVLNQYAIPPPPPISRMAVEAKKLVRFAESYPEPETYFRKYEGPYPDLSSAYGK